MPRVKCHFCPKSVDVKYKRYVAKGEDYIAVCFHCYKLKEKPEEFRCLGTRSTGERCNAWCDYNNNSRYCKTHKEQERNKNGK